jgi:DtxR family Mn-dependent transcriptional regulator
MRNLASLTSKSLEDYLSTIFRLESVFGVARTGDIAYELNVNYGTVTNMLSKFEKLGLLKRQRYEGVNLTEKGKVLAEEAVRRHRITERLLTDIIGVRPEEAHKLAHKLEHDVEDIIDRIDYILGYPDRCPHGNPISRKARMEKNELRLKETREGQKYFVDRIPIEDDNVMKFLNENDLWIGQIVKIVQVRKSNLMLEVNNKTVDVPIKISKLIFVRKVMKNEYV